MGAAVRLRPALSRKRCQAKSRRRYQLRLRCRLSCTPATAKTRPVRRIESSNRAKLADYEDLDVGRAGGGISIAPAPRAAARSVNVTARRYRLDLPRASPGERPAELLTQPGGLIKARPPKSSMRAATSPSRTIPHVFGVWRTAGFLRGARRRATSSFCYAHPRAIEALIG